MKWEPMAVRFWRKVEKQADGCWIWTGSRSLKLAKPYGMFRVNNRLTRRAHILSYELYYGPVPDGMELDHTCRNTLCVRPEHLEPVTHAENIRRGLRGRLHERPSHCANGHALTPDNLAIRVETNRWKTFERWRCKQCEREKTQRWRARKE